MRILVGCSSPPDIGAGGILTYTKEIIESLLERGHEITLAAPAPQNWSWVENNSLEFIETCQYKDPRESVKKLLEFISSHQIEGVINNDNPYVQSVLPAVNCPSIVVGHLGESVIASLACYQVDWSDYVVTISNDMYSQYVKKYHVPVTKCPIVFNGVKDNGCNENLENPEGKLRIVFAGGYNKRKGCLDIIKSVKKYSERFENVELNWFGNVPSSIKESLACYDFIKIHGKVKRDEFVEVLRDADALLFPSKSEGCPMAMLEAMSMGVVPIASNGKGAMDSLITSGKEGYICQLHDWANQATQCIQLLDRNRTILNDMKRLVRKRFVDQFQREEVGDRLVDLLSKPVVIRDKKPDRIKVLHWHRVVPKGKTKATIPNRIRFKLGVLRVADILHL